MVAFSLEGDKEESPLKAGYRSGVTLSNYRRTVTFEPTDKIP